MRKLKLQMQVSVDGFVAGPKGQLDWMTWTWDNYLMEFVSDLTKSVGSILMGRKMADGFMRHWEAAVDSPEDPSQPFAKLMVDYPKIIFSKSNQVVTRRNATMATRPLVDATHNYRQSKNRTHRDKPISITIENNVHNV